MLPPSDPVRVLFEQLRQDGVRIGVYKNTAQIEAGLRGETDLDLLAARDDADAMRRTLRQCGGVPAQPGRFHDNTGANREDWFVPLGDCRFLHLDIAIGMTIGPKYRKRYRVFDFEDVRDWQTLQAADGVRLSCVSPQDDLRIALLRSVFQPSPVNQIDQTGEDDAAFQPLPYRIGAKQFSCKPVATPSGPSLTESDRRKRLSSRLRWRRIWSAIPKNILRSPQPVRKLLGSTGKSARPPRISRNPSARVIRARCARNASWNRPLRACATAR